MGRFAIGRRAFGVSWGADVKVLKEAPGPHSMRAWKPGVGSVACGIARVAVAVAVAVAGRGVCWSVGGG
jgi:hypothetical protein